MIWEENHIWQLYNCTGAKGVGVGGTLPPGKYTLLKPSADRAQAYIPVDIVRKSSVMLEEKNDLYCTWQEYLSIFISKSMIYGV